MRARRLRATGLAILLAWALPNATRSDGAVKSIQNAIGMKLVLVPSGEFSMGSDKDEPEEKPRHRVRITKPFYLGLTEVTQQEYWDVMGTNPSRFSATGEEKDKVPGKATGRHPVEQVSWDDAVMFCNKLSAKEGLPAYYALDGDPVSMRGGTGYRLPTEAEWEYACRGGPEGTGVYSFGGDPAKLSDHAWFTDNSAGKTHPVGGKTPNAWGLYDMHGNVWEWCWDEYAADYYGQSPVDDPSGPSRARGRVFRGGCWNDTAESCQSATRGGEDPAHRNDDLGFRVARFPSGP